MLIILLHRRRDIIITPQFCLRGRTVAGAIKVAIGTNSNIKYGFMPSTHAEIDAIEKIKHKNFFNIIPPFQNYIIDKIYIFKISKAWRFVIY